MSNYKIETSVSICFVRFHERTGPIIIILKALQNLQQIGLTNNIFVPKTFETANLANIV